MRLRCADDSSFDPYPIDDDTPMTSSQEQYDAMTYSRSALASLMEAKGEPYILKVDFGLYYEAIDPALSRRAPFVAPDVMPVLDVTLPPFTPYRLWEVGKAPDLVLEIASPGAKPEDATKRALYARLAGHRGILAIRAARRTTDARSGMPPVGQGPLRQGLKHLPPRYRSVVDRESCLGRGLGSTGALRLWDPARKEWFPTYIEAAAPRIQAEQELAQIQRPIEEVHLRQANLAEMDPDAVAQGAVQSLDQIVSIF